MRSAALRLLALGMLAGCMSSPGSADTTSSSSAATSSATSVAMAQTQNVSFRGTIAPAGISIYMEGTHRLELADGRFLLLESTTVDLDATLGSQVEVEGAVRPTVEAGGVIMTVARLTPMALVDASSLSSASSSDTTSSSHATTSVATLATSSTSTAVSTSSSAPSSAPATSSTSKSTSSSSSIAALSSATSASASKAASTTEAKVSGRFSEEMLTRATAMASDDLSPARWTQQYCSSHVGFCIPIHKNWWFKSFGAMSAALWQVEISNGPIDLPGTGPVVVKVLSGTVEAQKATDGLVRAEGEAVIGYRAWTDNRHIEVTAPAGLDAIVRFITEGVKGV